jgi:hypothetical protein
MCGAFHARFLRLCVVSSFIIIFTGGCNEARENLASVIRPKTVEDIVITVNEKIAQSKFSQARSEGEEFLKANKDPAGNLAWALAKACAQTGEYEAAIQYLQQALSGNASYVEQAMSEPLLEPIRTDIRFVSLISGINPVVAPVSRRASGNSSQVEISLPSSTGVTLSSGGIEARSGGVVVKLPD